MYRTTRSIALAVGLTLASAGIALAAPPAKGCPNEASGFATVDLNFTWMPGHPIPGPGGDAWWDLTVAGLAAEGLTPDTAAPLFGFATAEELYEFVVLGIRGVDKNGDHAICWKAFPDHDNGTPAYIINVVDNNAR